MKTNWYRILPWMALISGILVFLLLGLGIILKPSRNNEGTVNRKIALDKLRQIRIENADNLNSKAFFDYFDETLYCSVISTKWLVSGKGEVIYAKGVMAASTPLNSNIYSLVDGQSRGLIDAVECNIDSVQKRMLYLAASIRREGDHNDLYGHLVIPLKTSSNVLVGFAGVAYSLDDAEPSIQNYSVIIVALLICFLLYWLALPLWVYFDCREKNNNYVLWSIFVLLGNIPALVAYLVSNKK